MNDLATFFWNIFLVFTVICVALCIEAHFRYQNKRGIDDDSRFPGHYRYFGQSIRNDDHQIVGYELLLREFNDQDQQWQLPKHVTDYPLSQVVQAVKQIDTTVPTLAINMTTNQLLDFRADRFFNWILGVVDHQIIIELSAADLLTLNYFQRRQLQAYLLRIQHHQVRVVIEGVDSSSLMFKRIRPFLTVADYLKFNADAFNKSADHWIDVTLNQWKRQLSLYHVKPILGRVESQAQLDLADKLGINIRQGYVYDQPTPLNIVEQ